MHIEVAMPSTLQLVVIGGLLLPQEGLEHSDPPTFRAQQVNIIMALQKRVENSPLGVFSMEDLRWAHHVINGKGIPRFQNWL